MANFKKPHFAAFGPPIPVVPIGDFSHSGLTERQWADAWWLCGPSAEQNMRGRRLELWQVIACAYLEGLQHGAGIERERHERSTRTAVDGNVENSEWADPVL